MRRMGVTRATGQELAERDASVSALSEVGSGLTSSKADVGVSRERSRRRRLLGLFALLMIPAAYLWGRLVSGDPFDIFNITLPQVDLMVLMPALFFLALILVLVGSTVGAGRSPHVTYRPEQIDVTLDDVKGIDLVKDDVVRSLQPLPGPQGLRAPRWAARRAAACSSRASPAPARPTWPRRWPREAGVPFLFVSATSFQSMYYGATARKIRSYFKALRKAARQEGGAIGFIEEIDAIAMARGGLSMSPLPMTRTARDVLRRASRGCRPCTPSPRPAASGTTVVTARHDQRGRRRRGQRAARADAVLRRPDRHAEAADLGRSTRSTCSSRCTASCSARCRRRPTCCSSPRPTAPTTSTRRCCAPAASTAGSPSSRRRKAGRRELIDFFLDRKAHDAELDDRRRPRQPRRGDPGLHAR